jgi:bifunctional non-homologous end joining protein LigD
MQERSTYLFMTQGSSDKQYNVHLRQQNGGWVVDFENGRRGKPLRSGTKTKDPVDYDTALTTFEKTVKGKTSKGYTEEESGIAYAGTDKAGEVTGFQPQLLNDITQEEAEALAETGKWYSQTKHDGERRGSLRKADEFIHSNRRGLRVGVAQPVQDALEKVVASGLKEFEFDCEDMGDHLVVFDILMLDGEDLRSQPFKVRADKLHMINMLMQKIGVDDAIRVDEPQLLTSVKELHQRLAKARSDNEEGLVFKDGEAPATAGRPASGGPARKLKFWESATCRVASSASTKRSISLELYDGKAWQGVGNCTLPANRDFPADGTLVEIKYLYAYEGGKLFQPAYLGPRTDITEDAASIDQLKYKREVDVSA